MHALILLAAIAAMPPTPKFPSPPVPQFEVSQPTRVIVGYRRECRNGVCTSVPIYADVPPATPGHTHAELGGRVCDVCGRSCYMLRAAEAAAAAKGETSDAAVRAGYQRMYGSGQSYTRPFRRWRR